MELTYPDLLAVYGTEPQTLQAIQETGTDRRNVFLTSKIYRAHPTDDEIREVGVRCCFRL